MKHALTNSNWDESTISTVKSDRIAGIDGLRAIAVLSILIFHLDPAWLPGGFTGVDIFYVISGFVVARSVRPLPANTFKTFAGSFFRRRVLRIYPALSFFVLMALLFCTLFLPFGPEPELIDIVGLSSLFALSNFTLMHFGDSYFQAASTFHPFMHTWSLAVEEQYYLIFPVFAFFLLSNRVKAAKARKWTTIVLAVSAIMSLLACALMTEKMPNFAFFMLPARFWELGLGLFLYVGVDYIQKNKIAFVERNLGALCGALAVMSMTGLAATFVFATETAFPYPWALLPCLSTAGLIAAITLHRSSIWARLLSLPPILWVGGLSYSLYLWHWGVITGMRWTTGVDTLGLRVIAITLTFALSVCSYKLIEQPVRNNKFLKSISLRRFGAGFAGYLVIVTALGSLLIVSKHALSLSVTSDTQHWLSDALPDEHCPSDIQLHRLYSGREFIFTPGKCVAVRHRKIFFLGDSHTGAYYRLAYRLASEAGYKTYLLTLGGCKSVGLNSYSSTISGCQKFQYQAMKTIVDNAKPSDILILSGLQAPRFRDYWDEPIRSEVPGEFDVHPSDRALAVNDANRLTPFVKAGMFTLIELPKPVMASALSRCSDWFNRGNAYCVASFPATRALLFRRSIRSRAYLSDVSDLVPRSRLWNSFDTLCPGTVCEGRLNGYPIYNDTDHVSGYGNDLIYSNLIKELKELY